VKAEDSPKNPEDAQKKIKRVEELRGELESYDHLKNTNEKGKTLMEKDPGNKDKIVEMLQGLEEDHKALEETIQKQKTKLEEDLSLMNFDRKAQEIEFWLDEMEGMLSSDSGSLPETQEGLEDLEKRLDRLQEESRLQQDKVEDLDQEATSLVEANHSSKDHIGTRRDKIMERWRNLGAGLEGKKKEIQNASKLQHFMHDLDELEGWVRAREPDLEQLRSEEQGNVKERSKKQEEELLLDLAGRRKRLEELKSQMKSLEEEEDFDAAPAQKKVAELESLLDSLMEGTEKTSALIQGTILLQQTEQDFDDLELWFRETEALLASEDLGSDLVSVQALLKKHSLVERDIEVHEEAVNNCLKNAQSLIESNHPGSEKLKERKEAIAARYAALQEKAKARRGKLEESLRLQKYLRDVSEEKEYVRYKTTVVSSSDLGKDPTSAGKLLSKHKVLSDELEAHHKSDYEQIKQQGKSLVDTGALSQEAITPALSQLEEDWKHLQELASNRSKDLEESVEWHDFKTDQEDELRWIEQAIRSLENGEPPGETLTSCRAQVAKHDGFLSELKGHEARVHSVLSAGTSLVQRSAGHSSKVSEAQKTLQERLARLQELAEGRRELLDAALERQVVEKKALEVEKITKESRGHVAALPHPTDLASARSNLDELEKMIPKMESTTTQVEALELSKKKLLEKKQAGNEQAAAHCDEAKKRWDEFRAEYDAKKRELGEQVAKYKEADELCVQFAEKAVALNGVLDNSIEDLSEPTAARSVESATALQKQHGEFCSSLEGIKKDYEELLELDRKIAGLGVSQNPYTPFKASSLTDKWNQMQQASKDRGELLQKEMQTQKEKDELCRSFADLANPLGQWMAETRSYLLEAGASSLEEQLESIKAKNQEIKDKMDKMKEIDELSAKLEAALILENKYTEQTPISIAQNLQALKQLGMAMEHSVEQKIIAKNSSGVTEEQKNEWVETFNYFDKDKSGFLEYKEFKTCLRGCGIDSSFFVSPW